jgi:hypothetical protein
METFLNGYLPDLEMHICHKMLQEKNLPLIESGYFKFDRFVSGYDANVDSLHAIASTFAPMHIDKVKVIKVTEADAKKKQMLNAGFTVNDLLFDSDTTAELRYLQLATKFQADQIYSTQWKAANNVWVTMDYALFQQVKAAFEAHIQSVYTWLAIKQAEINNAQNIDALNAIEI